LLAELASARFLEMSNGRYRFTPDGQFDVIDGLAADTVRPCNSLSGGETFLASLALALGLSDAASRHGGRLQCFFLDEGFAALDADTLERAVEGIEHLVSEDRLIALVSHLPALSERVDDKIVLELDDAGETHVVRGGRLS
jgi:exonuclease SbcC